MLAVIETGGKQYLVSPKQKIRVEKINAKEGDEFAFDRVLLLEKQNKLQIGASLVEGAKVTAKILRHGKGDKVVIFKYKAKARSRVKKGHRQPYTEVEILNVESK